MKTLVTAHARARDAIIITLIAIVLALSVSPYFDLFPGAGLLAFVLSIFGIVLGFFSIRRAHNNKESAPNIAAIAIALDFLILLALFMYVASQLRGIE